VSGYEYGNTRLAARRSALLRAEQYAVLPGDNARDLLAGLAATPYRPQAEAAAKDSGERLEPFYRMTRDHLIAALTGIASFYTGPAGEVVAALLGRFDLHNSLTLLRARHHGTAPGHALSLLLPVGRLGAQTAREVASLPDLPAAARLLAARRLPDRDTAAVLLAAQRTYELDTELGALEQAVTHSARTHQVKVLTESGQPAAEAEAALRREADDLNLVLILRQREQANGRDAASAGTAGQPHLPGGTLRAAQLTVLRRAPARADVLAAAVSARPAWRGPLAAWADGGSLATLHADLETQRLRTQCRMLRRGDPLGAAPVLYYVLAHEAQARNVRLLAQAAVGILTQPQARGHLVVPVLTSHEENQPEE
jgi:V/A-type H+-transporting ATPase subunit C